MGGDTCSELSWQLNSGEKALNTKEEHVQPVFKNVCCTAVSKHGRKVLSSGTGRELCNNASFYGRKCCFRVASPWSGFVANSFGTWKDQASSQRAV